MTSCNMEYCINCLVVKYPFKVLYHVPMSVVGRPTKMVSQDQIVCTTGVPGMYVCMYVQRGL